MATGAPVVTAGAGAGAVDAPGGRPRETASSFNRSGVYTTQLDATTAVSTRQTGPARSGLASERPRRPITRCSTTAALGLQNLARRAAPACGHCGPKVIYEGVARRWLLLSDVHLETAPHVERELAVQAVLAAHPGTDVVFLGDLFEFATAPAEGEAALAALLAANPTFCAALRAHAATGARVHWVAGNHDAALAGLEHSARRLLGIDVAVWPWFLRAGSVHLEHGHVFDRDNAPLHPLARWDVRDEPLGVELMRKIVVGLGVRQWAHAHQTTPARALNDAFRWFGWTLPARFAQGIWVLARVSSDSLAGRWGRARRADEEGSSRVSGYAACVGLPEAALRDVLSARAEPTHSRFGAVFRRVYLDWVSALLVTVAGAGVGLATGASWPWAATLIGGGYAVRQGMSKRESRYPPPMDALRQGALHIAAVTGAARVVFGHTHVEEEEGPYTNLGSFGYGSERGRAYGLVTDEGVFTRCYLR